MNWSEAARPTGIAKEGDGRYRKSSPQISFAGVESFGLIPNAAKDLGEMEVEMVPRHVIEVSARRLRARRPPKAPRHRTVGSKASASRVDGREYCWNDA